MFASGGLAVTVRSSGDGRRERSQWRASEKARRREAREIVGAYHQEQLRILLGDVRDGFARLDAGEIDEFDLDDLIHRYNRSARKLWSFCGASGSQWLQAAAALEYMRDRDVPERSPYDSMTKPSRRSGHWRLRG